MPKVNATSSDLSLSTNKPYIVIYKFSAEFKLILSERVSIKIIKLY